MRIGVIHGPNLNLLGRRDAAQYGDASLETIDQRLLERAGSLGVELATYQSNHEGALIDWIQGEMDSVHGWLVNPGALGHTSIALRDALEASGRPLVEVHLSNIFSREQFRAHTYLSDIAIGIVTGFRADSYLLGLQALVGRLAADAAASE